METLDASLQIARNALDPELVPAAAADQLTHIAQRLAPIHCAGFEVRLAKGEASVDLIQRLRVATGEPRRLRRHIVASALDENPAWARLGDFCERWSRPDSVIHRMVVVGFLGFDADATLDANSTPSVYLSLENGAGAGAAHLPELIAAAAALLRGSPLPDDVTASVDRCCRRLPKGAAIGDVGFMLARNVDAVRLVVAGLPREQLAAFLASLDWQGQPPDVAPALDVIPSAFRRLTASLDVGRAVFPRVGLEYYPGHRDADRSAWVKALDKLSAAGLCTARKRDALLRWPGHTEPPDTTDPWPASLVLASLLNRSDQFMVLSRRLTFLKLVCQPGREIEAKAYFGYGPRSYAVAGDTEIADGELSGDRTAGGGVGAVAVPTDDGSGAGALQASVPGVKEGGDTGADLVGACDRAIDRGVAYLLDRRDADGLWREFPRVLEGTDEWATAYIARVLASAGGEQAREVARDVWDALCDRRGPDDGWGYSAALPADADSTLWGLRLAAALGLESSPRARAARRILEQHVMPDGGVATYAADAEPRLRTLLGDANLDGMFVSHTCVSAAAAAPTALGNLVAPFVVGRQESDGRWRGYWWSDDEYTTWLAVDALSNSSGPIDQAALTRAHHWAAGRFDRDGAVWARGLAAPSAFAAGLCLEIMQCAAPASFDASASPIEGAPPPVTAVRRILETQRPNGSWPASALMRMPPTDAADGDARPEATTVSVDDRALFTTATLVRALARTIETIS